jgi:hypothetical protein
MTTRDLVAFIFFLLVAAVMIRYTGWGRKQTKEQKVQTKSCGPWQHQWSKWTTIAGGKLLKTTNAVGIPFQQGEEKTVIGTYEEQRRECERCGMSQLRETHT